MRKDRQPSHQSPEYLRTVFRALGMSEQTSERAVQYSEDRSQKNLKPDGEPEAIVEKVEGS